MVDENLDLMCGGGEKGKFCPKDVSGGSRLPPCSLCLAGSPMLALMGVGAMLKSPLSLQRLETSVASPATAPSGL